MRALVVFESMYGNTRAVADAIAEELGGSAVSVHEAIAPPVDLDLLIVAGPTHMHGLATSLSRRLAAQAAEEDGGAALDPGATAGPGLRRWLHELPPGSGTRAAAFDTRLDRSPAHDRERRARDPPPAAARRLRRPRNRELPGRGLRGPAGRRRA